MNKEEFVWLSKYIKDARIMKSISNRSNDFIDTLMNYINLCSGNINMDVIKKIIETDTDKKAELIVRVSSNTSFMLSKSRSYEEKLRLIDKIKDASTDLNAEYIAKIVSNISVNKRRSFVQQDILIDKINSVVDDLELSKIVSVIATNSQILKRRTFEEQLSIIDLIEKADTDLKKIYMQAVSTNDFVLKNYSAKEHIELLSKVFESDSDVKTLLISNYINLGIKKRNFYEKLGVIEIILKSKNDSIASYIEYIASNPNLLMFLNSQNHSSILQRINLADSEEKARCMSLAILNQYKITDDDIESVMSLFSKIDSLDNDMKVSCIDSFIIKSDFFFKSDFEEQGVLIDLVASLDDENIKDYINMLDCSNITAKMILSSKEFLHQKEITEENKKKSCKGCQKNKIKSLFMKGN